MIAETVRALFWATLFILALVGAAVLLTGCAEMKYAAKCATDINANCN